jgi:hypothetical protein
MLRPHGHRRQTGDADGLPHTSRLHLVERLTRVNFETLNYEVTIDDNRRP